MPKKILVTGAAGFVGRHLTHALLKQGHLVVAVDNLVPLTGAKDPSKGWPFYMPFDFSNFVFHRADCRDWFKSNVDADFDYAYHAAAMVGGRMMIENNPLAVAEDLSIDAEFWNWAKVAKPRKSICFSSSAAYPIGFQRESDYRLLKEDMIDFNDTIGMPDMTYGWAKLTSEYSHLRLLSVVPDVHIPDDVLPADERLNPQALAAESQELSRYVLPAALPVGRGYADALLEEVEGSAPPPAGIRALFPE